MERRRIPVPGSYQWGYYTQGSEGKDVYIEIEDATEDSYIVPTDKEQKREGTAAGDL